MASDNPFAGLGLGMMGSDASYAKAAMQGDGKKGPLSILLGQGLDWLGDQFSDKKTPQGAVPSPAPTPSAAATQPVPPVNYGFNGGLNMPQANAPVVPYAQTAPVTLEENKPTDGTQLTVGGYRKFLRPQGFGVTQQ